MNAIIFQRWYSVILFTDTALPLRYGFFYSYILTLWFNESAICLCLSWEVSTWRCPKKTYILLQTVPLHTFFYVYGQDAWGLSKEHIADPQPVALPKTETFILLISSSTFLITRHNNAKVFSTSSIPLPAALLSSFSISLIRILENVLWGSFLAQLQPYYHLICPKLTWFLDSFTLIISLGLENTLLPQATSWFTRSWIFPLSWKTVIKRCFTEMCVWISTISLYSPSAPVAAVLEEYL